jgi:hypothetical protein
MAGLVRHGMRRRIALGVVGSCLTVIVSMVTAPTPPASALVNPDPVRPSVPRFAPPGPQRIVLYGDSLVSEAAQDFSLLAGESGASVQARTYPGTAICDFFSKMAADAAGWHPTIAVLAFSGDAFTPCMWGVQLGSPQYFARYRDDTQQAISIFRSVGTKVVLVGLPLVASPGLSQNVSFLNAIYQLLADGNPGVTYDDAGQAVLANGRFTWALACLPGEPCSGPNGTNVVRSPDGVHFCPDGKTAFAGGLEECDVYSSGALRFASAMLAPVLPSRPPSPVAGSPPAVCRTELSHMKRSKSREGLHAATAHTSPCSGAPSVPN